MRATGKKMWGMEKVMRDTQMEINMREIFKMEKHMEKVSMLGWMEKFLMVNGRMELKKATEYGKASLVIHSLESGRIVRLMGTVSINGKMVTDMKVNGATA
jgi:hypothetical protein